MATVGQCWYLRALIGSRRVELLVDSGSMPCILDKSVYDSLQGKAKRPLKESPVRLFGASGVQIEVYGQTMVELNLEDDTFEIPCLIADLAHTMGVLGMNFFYSVECELNLSKGYLDFQGRRYPLHQQEPAGCNKVFLSHPEKIQEGACVKLKGVLEGDICVGEEELTPWRPDREFVEGTGLHALDGAIKVSKEGRVEVSWMNLGGGEVKLNPGTLLGYVEAGKSSVSMMHADPAAEEIAGFPPHLRELFEDAAGALQGEETGAATQLIKQYGSMFAAKGEKLGQTDLVTHEIFTGDAPPQKQPVYRLPLAQQVIVTAEVHRLLEEGLIRPSNSPWSAPVVLVSKSDGSPRLCCNYKALNQVTRKDSFPLPNIAECLEAMGGATCFHSIDLLSGFHQVKVHVPDIPKTAFVTKEGMYEWIVMPFGLCNAPASFQRLMESILRGLQWKTAILYIDDILVFGKTVKEAGQNLGVVLQRLQEAGLKLKASKCQLFRKQVHFLGHVVSQEGIACDPGKLEAVADWPEPKDLHQLRSFLGFSGYYRKFIPEYSQKATPLVALLAKGRKFGWSRQCQQAFDSLKSSLVKPPVLGFPISDPESVFILDSDCSLMAMGAVLSQLQFGEEKVIAYGSKTLNAAQKCYCNTYRELLALVHFTKYYKHFLLGRRFLARVDHGSLRWLLSFKDQTGILGRWIAQLAPYDMEIQHRMGRLHSNADGLSRRPESLKKCCERLDCPECPRGLVDPDTESPVELLVTEPVEHSPAPAEDPRNPSKPGKVEAGSKGTSSRSQNLDSEACTEKVTKAAESNTAGVNLKRSLNPQTAFPVAQADPESVEETAGGSRNQSRKESNWLQSWSQEELREMQNEDPEVSQVMEWRLVNAKPSWAELQEFSPGVRALCAVWKCLVINEGLLCREWTPRFAPGQTLLQLVAPRKIRWEIMHHLHDHKGGGSHLGVKKTLEKVRSRFYWMNCKADINRWIKHCSPCAQVKPGPRFKAEMTNIIVRAPLELLGMDILGPLPRTQQDHVYILCVTDYFTKWVEAYALPDQTAYSIADVFATQFVTRFGLPTRIVTDQGRNFEGVLFGELCRMFGVTKHRTTPYHARCNGQTERFNSTLQMMLKAVCSDRRDDWDDWLPFVMMSYRASVHESTQCSPNLMFLGKETNLAIDLMVGNPQANTPYHCEVEYVEWIRKTIYDCHEYARKKLGGAAKRQKTQYDSHTKPHRYQIGSYVWRWYPPIGKLAKGWVGPWKIIGRPTEINVEIRRSPTLPVVRVHVDSLKPYLGDEPELWGEEQLVSSQSDSSDEEQETEGELDQQEQREDIEIEEELGVEVEEEGEEAGNEENLPVALRRKRRHVKPPQRLDW